MADAGYINGLLAGIPDQNLRRILEEAFRHLLREQRFGEPDHHTKAKNFAAYFQAGTSATSTSEFSITHGMATAPRLAIPALDLNHVGCGLTLMEVTRVSDHKRVYLKAAPGSTGVPFLMLVE